MTHREIIRKLLKEAGLNKTKLAVMLGKSPGNNVCSLKKDTDIMMQTFLEVIENLGYKLTVQPVATPVRTREMVLEDWI